MAQCIGTNRDGSRCKANAMPGQRSCYRKSHGASVNPLKRFWNLATNNKLLSLLAILGFLLAIYQEYENWQASRQNAMAGTLNPSQSEMWTPVILGGGIPIAIKSADGVLLRDGPTPLLTVTNDGNGKAVFSLDIEDSAGSLIARMQGNEWSLEKATLFDRNYSDNVLEVEDTYGQVVLQAVNLGDAFYIAGRFRCENGEYRWFERGPGNEGIWGPFGTNATSPSYPIPPLCRYPSALHQGVCANRDSVSQWRTSDPSSQAHFVTGSLDICTT